MYGWELDSRPMKTSTCLGTTSPMTGCSLPALTAATLMRLRDKIIFLKMVTGFIPEQTEPVSNGHRSRDVGWGGDVLILPGGAWAEPSRRSHRVWNISLWGPIWTQLWGLLLAEHLLRRETLFSWSQVKGITHPSIMELFMMPPYIIWGQTRLDGYSRKKERKWKGENEARKGKE